MNWLGLQGRGLKGQGHRRFAAEEYRRWFAVEY